jgi:NTE family protein
MPDFDRLNDNTPLTYALDQAADEVYVLSTGGPCTLTEPPRGALAIRIPATLLVGQRLAVKVLAIRRTRPCGSSAPIPVGVHPPDFGHAEDLLARAEAAARGAEHSADLVGSGNIVGMPTSLDGLPAAG